MRKHLPKCPKKKREELLHNQPYYSAGINLGSSKNSETSQADCNQEAPTQGTHNRGKARRGWGSLEKTKSCNFSPWVINQNVDIVVRKLLSHLPFEELKAFVDKIAVLHSRFCPTPLSTEMLRHPECEPFFESRMYVQQYDYSFLSTSSITNNQTS